MILYISTSEKNLIRLSIIKKSGRVIARERMRTDFDHAEKLLPSIMMLLKKWKIILDDITAVKVANHGGSFTSLRIGVVTANAIGYALRIPVLGDDSKAIKFRNFNIIGPFYDKEPNITIKESTV